MPKKFAAKQPAGANGQSRNSHNLSELIAAADNLIQDAPGLFKALADKNRLRIIHFLVDQEEMNVRSMCDLLNLRQPVVSHHIKTLVNAGLLSKRRNGRHNFYRFDPGRIRSTFHRLGSRWK